MNEGTPISWIWMVFPLSGLALNLVWPRKRGLKALGIIVLLFTAYLHALLGLLPLARGVAAAERALTNKQRDTTDYIANDLRIGQSLAAQTMYHVCIGLTLAVVFAATPFDIIARVRSFRRRGPFISGEGDASSSAKSD